MVKNLNIMEIQYAQAEDITEMQKLWQDMPGIGLSESDNTASLADFLKRNPTTCLLLKEGNGLIGTVLGGYDGRRGYIYHLAVVQHKQLQGNGRLLLEQVCQELKKLGAFKIHLLVYENNIKARDFYIKQKWKKRDDVYLFSWEV